jgi:hypothetical protein
MEQVAVHKTMIEDLYSIVQKHSSSLPENIASPYKEDCPIAHIDLSEDIEEDERCNNMLFTLTYP